MADTGKHRPQPTTQSHPIIRDPDTKPLRLVVMGDKFSAAFQLEGDATIGRSPAVDVHIDHLSVSRRHARIHVGPPLAIEDLGSANGTRVGGVLLRKGEKHRIDVGDVIELGDLIAVLQGIGPARPRRLWVHGYFETRFEGECERARRAGSALAVVRVSCRGSPPASTVEEALFDSVRSADVVGYYAPNEFEVLLVDTGPEDTRLFCRRLELELSNRGIGAGVGVAVFPLHGRSADQLLAHAGNAARGGEQRHPVGRPGFARGGVAMAEVFRQVERVAPSDINVLLLGETGVGKEVLAEYIHAMSRRAAAPLVKVHCAAMPETLLENELFGHEKGAFTGADQSKVGLLESAEGGTVMLDEIGELPLSMQVKLLRVLEERAVRRIGGLKPREIDVRFIAATNRDLQADVARGTFRADLFYRLSGAPLVIPPLRERPDEIEPLVEALVAEASADLGMPAPPPLSAAAWTLLKSYSWPGNIRELKNCVERAVLLCGGKTIDVEHIAREKMAATRSPGSGTIEREFADQVTVTRRVPKSPPVEPAQEPLAEALRREIDAVERRYIVEALDQVGGHQAAAAELLGMSRRTLQYRLRTLGITGRGKRES